MQIGQFARIAQNYAVRLSEFVRKTNWPVLRLYGEPNAVANAIGYAKHRSRSHDALIRVYDDAGNVTQTHEHAGEFKEW